MTDNGWWWVKCHVSRKTKDFCYTTHPLNAGLVHNLPVQFFHPR